MGIYILLNRYYFQTRRGRYKHFKERKRIIENIINSDMFKGFESPICFFIKGVKVIQKKIEENISYTDALREFKNNYNKEGFDHFEFKSNIRLYQNENLDLLEIPVKIKVRKKKNLQGHLIIEFDSKQYEFNEFFLGSEKSAIQNKNKVTELINSLNQTALGTITYLFRKVNIGKDAFPFENVKNAFFIWRNKDIDAFRDIMMFRAQLRKEIKKIDLKQLNLRERNRIQKIINDMVKPYDLFYVPRITLDKLTMNIVLKHTHLLDEYFQTKAVVEQNSYSLQTPRGSNELLFPILYDMNLKINQVYSLKIPKKSDMDELMREGLFEVFKDKDEYLLNLTKRKEVLLSKFDKYYIKKLNMILNLDQNWDEYNSKKYKQRTLDKANKFLRLLLENFLLLYNLELELPRIFPGMNGDIDIEWKNDKFQLLISIPEKENELAGLYGDNFRKDVIKFDFNINEPNLRLLAWLKRQI